MPDVIDKAESGDIDGAVRSCHAMFNAGCSLGDEPMLIAQIVRIDCQAEAVYLLMRALAQGEPGEAVLSALQARMESSEAEPLLLYGLRGERAGGQRFLQNIRDGGTVPPNNSFNFYDLAPLSSTYLFNVPGYVATQQAGHLRFMTEMVEVAKLPPEKWSEPLAAQRAKRNQLPEAAHELFWGVKKGVDACQRNHAVLRCAVVSLASERFRRRTGNWPSMPNDLVKAGLLKMVPGDPYAADQSIMLAHPTDGLIVYSTGPDGKDDGRKLEKYPIKPGTDLGFRLWDVAARRQPPLPPKP